MRRCLPRFDEVIRRMDLRVGLLWKLEQRGLDAVLEVEWCVTGGGMCGGVVGILNCSNEVWPIFLRVVDVVI